MTSKLFEVCEECPITNKKACIIAFGSKECAKILVSGIKKQVKAEQYEAFYEANRDKECELCGCGLGEVALFEVHKIMDSEMVFDGETIVLCHNCMTGVDFIEFFDAVRK